MRKITVFTNLTLDGVMQAPAAPDEDPRGGFEHGGGAAPYAAMQEAGDALAFDGALLFGRRTYEQFASFWPNQRDNPMAEMLTLAPKYVASTTLQEPLPWANSTLLSGDAAEAVAQLKEEPGPNFLIMGSGELVQSLMRRNLVDEYVLLFHPLVLGSGHRLFPDGGAFAELKLVDSKPTSKGCIVATYHPSS